MEADRIKKEYSDPKYLRIPVFEDDSEDFIQVLNSAGNVIPFPYTRKQFKEKFTIQWED